MVKFSKYVPALDRLRAVSIWLVADLDTPAGRDIARYLPIAQILIVSGSDIQNYLTPTPASVRKTLLKTTKIGEKIMMLHCLGFVQFLSCFYFLNITNQNI